MIFYRNYVIETWENDPEMGYISRLIQKFQYDHSPKALNKSKYSGETIIRSFLLNKIQLKSNLEQNIDNIDAILKHRKSYCPTIRLSQTSDFKIRFKKHLNSQAKSRPVILDQDKTGKKGKPCNFNS